MRPPKCGSRGTHLPHRQVNQGGVAGDVVQVLLRQPGRRCFRLGLFNFLFDFPWFLRSLCFSFLKCLYREFRGVVEAPKSTASPYSAQENERRDHFCFSSPDENESWRSSGKWLQWCPAIGPARCFCP